MVPAVWDYIFAKSDTPPETDIPVEKLDLLRSSFLYWYPMDLRVSGKDLIRNHLTMCLYNHAAVWPDRPDLWPRSFSCNGHALLNDRKMSKAEGNFLTVNDCVSKYGADATRIVLADSGDTLDDANFREETANASVLKLTNFHDWVEKSFEGIEEMRTGEPTFFDLLFENSVNESIREAAEGYENMLFRKALKHCFYEMLTLRDEYKMRTMAINMHKDMFLRYMQIQSIILSPIAPHFCEALWKKYGTYMGAEVGMVIDQPWPQPNREHDIIQGKQDKYIRDLLSNCR
jgi:leucyl-tRNA synthetase